ncbi:MAG: helix-turn-helix domain-containing protein [Acidobacteria bacterium]|nr:helix-turn-helix domain-containing protein [Acidobacteriota bacterium]
MNDTFTDTKNAARKLGNLSPRTLEKWRVTGEGPAFCKFGRKVFYSERDLREWTENRRRRSTSDGD